MVCVLIGTARTRAHARTHTHERRATITPVCPLPLRPGLGSPFSPSLSLSLLSLLSLSSSQVNRGHVIKRPSLCPLTLVNEEEKKTGNKKQFCAANIGKKMITESDVCVFLPLCPGLDSSPAHIENRAADRTHGALWFHRCPTSRPFLAPQEPDSGLGGAAGVVGAGGGHLHPAGNMREASEACEGSPPVCT